MFLDPSIPTRPDLTNSPSRPRLPPPKIHIDLSRTLTARAATHDPRSPNLGRIDVNNEYSSHESCGLGAQPYELAGKASGRSLGRRRVWRFGFLDLGIGRSDSGFSKYNIVS